MPNQNRTHRSAGHTHVSVSLTDSLLELVDERAASLGLTRSLYISILALNDLTTLGPLVLKEREARKEPVNVTKLKAVAQEVVYDAERVTISKRHQRKLIVQTDRQVETGRSRYGQENGKFGMIWPNNRP
jgi:hypothetical protein